MSKKNKETDSLIKDAAAISNNWDKQHEKFGCTLNIYFGPEVPLETMKYYEETIINLVCNPERGKWDAFISGHIGRENTHEGRFFSFWYAVRNMVPYKYRTTEDILNYLKKKIG